MAVARHRSPGSKGDAVDRGLEESRGVRLCEL